MGLKEQMERIYQELPLDEIPWNLEGPPDPLIELVKSRRLLPCDALDLGCGAGNYAVWLATQGFRVTGVDISPRALELAKRLAAQRGVACRFLVFDLTGNVEQLAQSFDLAYDWEVLHHVFPEDRERYAANVSQMLRPGGTYLSVCFSEDDVGAFGGEGKYRRTRLGTTLYFSSEKELRDLFAPQFHIQELSTVQIAGKYGPHMAVKVLMTKRD
jgi:SAM-dependent methyltransferase